MSSVLEELREAGLGPFRRVSTRRSHARHVRCCTAVENGLREGPNPTQEELDELDRQRHKQQAIRKKFAVRRLRNMGMRE